MCYCQYERQPWIWFNEIKKHQIKLSALKTSSRMDIIFKGGGREGSASVVLSSELKLGQWLFRSITICEHLLPEIDWEPHQELLVLGGREVTAS